MSLANLLLDTVHLFGNRDLKRDRWLIWREYLRLQALQRGPGTITLFGTRMGYLDPSNLRHLYRDLFVNRVYDANLPDHPYIVDCGSNIGVSILLFKHLYPQARVVGFEPSPVLFPLLAKNAANFAGVTVHQKALSDQSGQIRFYSDPVEPGALNSGLYPTQRVSQAFDVDAVRLSDFINEPVDLLKLDVEGAEHLVLKDLAESGKIALVRNIICEYHHHHHGDRSNRLAEFVGTLERAGFGYQIDAFYRRQRDRNVYQDLMLYAYRV